MATINNCLPDDIIPLDELKQISESRQVKGVIKWLKTNNIPFIPSSLGSPRVHRNALAAAMGAPTTEVEYKVEPVKKGPQMDNVR